jgi:NAD-dependent deacetylase
MDLAQIGQLLRGDVLAFTGAGISAASGLPTFRGDGGLYEGLNPYELATQRAFSEHPATVWNWYLGRIHQGKDAVPNEAHLSLVDLEDVARRVTIITSNVDSLHEVAGSSRVFKLHGNLLESKCTRCGRIEPLNLDTLPRQIDSEHLFRCPCSGLLRPNVVWFGEMPDNRAVEAAFRGISEADIVLEIGTSGAVSYGFTEMAVEATTCVVRINPDPIPQAGVTIVADPAEEALPALVDLARHTT